jgi:hypothetical protein
LKQSNKEDNHFRKYYDPDAPSPRETSESAAKTSASKKNTGIRIKNPQTIDKISKILEGKGPIIDDSDDQDIPFENES